MEQEEIDIQVWEYIDGSCTPSEQQRIASLIAADTAWQLRYIELLTFHAEIAGSVELEQPSMRFGKNVMEAVAAFTVAPATKKYINPAIIRGIAAFFIITIAALLGYALYNADWNHGNTASFPSLLADKNLLNNIFNNNVFNIIVAVNIVLGLVMLDSFLRKKAAVMP